MFNNISWQGYWITLALLSAGYYLVIYFLYYRSDFTIILPKRKSPTSRGDNRTAFPPRANSASTSASLTQEEFEVPSKDSEEYPIYSLMNEVTAYFEEAKKARCEKEEVLYALRRILSKFPAVKSSVYKESLTNVIVSEAELHCSIHFSADDMEKVWLG
jgi:hypothetical protein